MSYDLTLYLKSLPEITAAQFTEICKACGLSVDACPDFTLDGSLSPLCAKFGGFWEGDTRQYLAAVDYSRSRLTESLEIELSPSPKKWWQLKKPKGETVEIDAGSEVLSFSCGMDSLELPLALLIACTLAGEEGVLVDRQRAEKSVAIGQSAITAWVLDAIEALETTDSDRLLLHEFDEWI